jgi:hypothetical protein
MHDLVFKVLIRTRNLPFLRLATRSVLRRQKTARLQVRRKQFWACMVAIPAVPLDFAWSWEAPYEWPENTRSQFGMPPLSIRIPGIFRQQKTLANVETWRIEDTPRDENIGRVAVIGHIATRKDNMRQHVGSALARSIFVKLHEAYGVMRIEFRETAVSTAHLYPRFFEALGARAVIPNQQGDKIYWVWEWDDIDFYDSDSGLRHQRTD